MTLCPDCTVVHQVSRCALTISLPKHPSILDYTKALKGLMKASCFYWEVNQLFLSDHIPWKPTILADAASEKFSLKIQKLLIIIIISLLAVFH